VNTYDGLSRLTQVKRTDLVIPSPVETTSYAYDAVGNRLRVAAPAGTTTNLFDSADRMTKTGTLTFAFDKAGNRTSEALSGGGTIQYTYDSVNRLTKVLTPTREIRYVYDGDGNKVEETIINRSTGAATTWKFLVDPSTPLPVILQELRFDNFGTALKEEIKYLHAGGVLQQVVTPTGGTSAFSYFHADGLGSIVTLTTANGSVGRQIRYDLWGRKETQSGSLRTRFGFTGEQQDLETGLVYLRARWYDPRHGIFLSRDPYQGTKGLPVSMHPYQYVHNNPATLVDPSGLLPGVKSFLGGVGKVGAGLASIPGGIVDAFRPSDGSAGEIIGKIVGGTETIVHTDYGDSGSASRAPVAVGLPSRSPKLVEPAPTRAPRLANPGPTRARATVPTDGPQRLANPVYQPQPPMRSPTTPPNQSAPQARGLVQVQTPASRALRQVESDVVVQSQGKALVLDEYTPVNPASDRK
jgi:RHS repeat-associated protein